jgi:hypothetical protein
VLVRVRDLCRAGARGRSVEICAEVRGSRQRFVPRNAELNFPIACYAQRASQHTLARGVFLQIDVVVVEDASNVQLRKQGYDLHRFPEDDPQQLRAVAARPDRGSKNSFHGAQVGLELQHGRDDAVDVVLRKQGGVSAGARARGRAGARAPASPAWKRCDRGARAAAASQIASLDKN